MLKEYLTSTEHIKIKNLNKTIEILSEESALIIIGVDTKKLSDKFGEYIISSHKNIKIFDMETIHKEYNIIKQIAREKDKSNYFYINLFRVENIEKIIKLLNYHRDSIFENELKLILLFDSESLKLLKQNAYDMFSRNSFSYQFTDHSYTPTIQIPNNKLDELISKYENTDNLSPKLKLEILFNIASEAQNISKLDLSMDYYQQAKNIAKEHSLIYEYSAIVGNIGNIYNSKGDLDLALKYLKEALEIHKEIGYTQGVTSGLGNIGSIYGSKGDLDLALKYLKEALEIDREIGYTQGVANQLGNIGVIYESKGDLDLALKYHKEALEIDREIGYTQGVASNLGNIGNIYESKGDLDLALKYLKEALEIDREIGYTQGVQVVWAI